MLDSSMKKVQKHSRRCNFLNLNLNIEDCILRGIIRRTKKVFKGLEILLNAGIKPKEIMVYMIIGYWPGETMDDILWRFNKLNDAGVLPYPMVYDRERTEHKSSNDG